MSLETLLERIEETRYMVFDLGENFLNFLWKFSLGRESVRFNWQQEESVFVFFFFLFGDLDKGMFALLIFAFD